MLKQLWIKTLIGLTVFAVLLTAAYLLGLLG